MLLDYNSPETLTDSTADTNATTKATVAAVEVGNPFMARPEDIARDYGVPNTPEGFALLRREGWMRRLGGVANRPGYAWWRAMKPTGEPLTDYKPHGLYRLFPALEETRVRHRRRGINRAPVAREGVPPRGEAGLWYDAVVRSFPASAAMYVGRQLARLSGDGMAVTISRDSLAEAVGRRNRAGNINSYTDSGLSTLAAAGWLEIKRGDGPKTPKTYRLKTGPEAPVSAEGYAESDLLAAERTCRPSRGGTPSASRRPKLTDASREMRDHKIVKFVLSNCQGLPKKATARKIAMELTDVGMKESTIRKNLMAGTGFAMHLTYDGEARSWAWKLN